MPPKIAQRSNFLLKITLIKTIDPTVTRLISIPIDLTFTELHLAIAAAFDWNDACTAWLFRIWSADPVQYCDQLKHKGGLAIYRTAPGFGYELKPTSLRTNAKVGQYLKKEGSGKFWTYDYDVSRLHHAIEVVDTVNDDQGGIIACLGGQGQVIRKAWQYADLGGLEGVTVGAKSTWDLDMRLLNQRLKSVQDAYEVRKENEAMKAAAKIKAPLKGNVTKPAPAKPKPKSNIPSKAKPPIKPRQPRTKRAVAQDKVAPTATSQMTPSTASATAASTLPPASDTHAIPTLTPTIPPTPTPTQPPPTTQPAPSNATNTNATTKPAAPETASHKSAAAVSAKTPADQRIPSAVAPSRKRPLPPKNQRVKEQAKKKTKVVKRETVVKVKDETETEDEDEKKNIVHLAGESTSEEEE